MPEALILNARLLAEHRQVGEELWLINLGLEDAFAELGHLDVWASLVGHPHGGGHDALHH